MLTYLLLSLGVSLCVRDVIGKCYDPSPAFPLPVYEPDELEHVFSKIEKSLKHTFADRSFDKTSFSIEVTSSEKKLWSLHHTARNLSDRGVREVDGNSLFRIASISKAFTTLAILQQHAAGNLSLDDTVDQYIHELKEPQKGTIPWKDITLRTLASQLSGIPREFAQSDLINEVDPTVVGLPPVKQKHPLKCAEAGGKPCERKDLLDALKAKLPVFAPNQKSTYSNNNFNLLGLVIENSTGLTYSDYIESNIFKPLGMHGSTLETPKEAHSVIPAGENYWGVEEGVQRPTGGIYSSTSDLSRFLRYVLTHYNGLTHSLNWLASASYSDNTHSFYGMPWEIFRTDKILRTSKRPITFVTKGGALPGYFSIIMMIAEYDLGITILVAGTRNYLNIIRELVTVPLMRAADEVAFDHLDEKYGGTYISTTPYLNSSIYISANPTTGLTLQKFISNSTDILGSAIPVYQDPDTLTKPWHAQLVPTLLFLDEKKKQGELWRAQVVVDRPKNAEPGDIWDDFCFTDVDPASYAGEPLNEFAFYTDEKGRVTEVELSAFRVRLERQKRGKQIMEEAGARMRLQAGL